MRFLKPAEITTLYLGFLYILAVLLKGTPEFYMGELIRAGAILVTFVLPSYLFIRSTGKHVQWDNLLITALLLLMLADPTAPILLTVALGMITTLFKIFIRIQKHPIFNPAAVSLAVLYLFGLTTTWWGVSFAPRFGEFGISSAMLLTLPLGLYIIKRYQKIPTLVATVGGVILGSLLLGGTIPYVLLLEGTFAFFLLIMATEPKTTPVVDFQEWIYGSVLGLSLAAWFSFNWPLPYILNLLILNVLFTVYKYVQIYLAQHKAPAEA